MQQRVPPVLPFVETMVSLGEMLGSSGEQRGKTMRFWSRLIQGCDKGGSTMKLSLRAGALVVAAASASLLIVPLALPASAVSQPAQCKKLVTKTVGSKVTATVSGCTPLAATGGSGSGTVASSSGTTAGTLNITIKWVKQHGTTKANIKFGPAVGPGKCALGSTRLKVTGKVTGGSGTRVEVHQEGSAGHRFGMPDGIGQRLGRTGHPLQVLTGSPRQRPHGPLASRGPCRACETASAFPLRH